jgi:UDP-N-acetyl-D-mannosaminuronic acid transferase (WecB/TagA/CpsF family)
MFSLEIAKIASPKCFISYKTGTATYFKNEFVSGGRAAFDFHAGFVRQVLPWIQKIGMEWFFLPSMEPRRLWKRYLKNNSCFIYKVFRQMLNARKNY